MSCRLVWAGILAAAVVLVAGAAPSRPAAAPAGTPLDTYRITDLGTLGGGFSYGAAVNYYGHVAGYATTESGATHAFRWQNGVLTDLGTLGGENSFASAINEAGDVVGTSETGALDPNGFPLSHAFLWHDGQLQDLGVLQPGLGSSAAGINNHSQVAGSADAGPPPAGGGIGSAPTHAFLWDAANGMQDLGLPAGGGASGAVAINDAGQV